MCYLCLDPLTETAEVDHVDPLHLDHVDPEDLDNVAMACRPCNGMKGGKTLAELFTDHPNGHDLARVVQGADPWDLLMDRVTLTRSGCWVARRNGYATVRVGGRRGVGAHRYTYELVQGPIPKGWTVDHLCAVPGCVNPDHLEAVTHRENVRRYHQRRALGIRPGVVWSPAEPQEVAA